MLYGPIFPILKALGLFEKKSQITDYGYMCFLAKLFHPVNLFSDLVLSDWGVQNLACIGLVLPL